MAELIDKSKFIEWFKENHGLERVDEDTGETTEYDMWISTVDVIDDIERFKSTTTEAEIRAKAIDEFAEKLSDAYSEHSTIIRLHGVDFDILTVDGAIEIMWDLAEQLKEE